MHLLHYVFIIRNKPLQKTYQGSCEKTGIILLFIYFKSNKLLTWNVTKSIKQNLISEKHTSNKRKQTFYK